MHKILKEVNKKGSGPSDQQAKAMNKTGRVDSGGFIHVCSEAIREHMCRQK